MFTADADDDKHLDVSLPKKADVYGFGIVYSEILTRKFSFQVVDFYME